ncbi:MAG: hypothetical protein IKW54_02285 [Bacteroidales bacterium]|nr:hypothetical protein [Bacteroidales bacterium]
MKDIILGFEVVDETTPAIATTTEMFGNECQSLAEGLALILGLVNIDRIKNHCTIRQAQSLDKAVSYINSLQSTNTQMRN